jgi:hypothetical protein
MMLANQFYQRILWQRHQGSVMAHANIEVEVFSNFGDKRGYSGFVPSATYLQDIYHDYSSHIRSLLDREIMKRDSTTLKGDHSFKVPKYVAKANGERSFDSLYTVTNEYEEVVIQIFALTKSHEEIREHLQNYVKGRQSLGHPLIKAFYTDDCCHDAAFLEENIPSLKEDVVPIQNLRKIRYRPLELPDDVQTTLVDSDQIANLIVEKWRLQMDDSDVPVIAVDTEWDRRTTSGVDLVQIMYENEIALFPVRKYGLSVVKELMQDGKILKVGLNFAVDIARLESMGMNVVNTAEIRKIAKDQGYITHANISLVDLTEKCLKLYMS